MSTKAFADTGEQTGFLSPTLSGSGSKEDDASSCDLCDDEDEGVSERENILKSAVLGMTQSARYLKVVGVVAYIAAMKRENAYSL